jgi:zinc D-Ala-D-Ala carboxypeptidase
MARTYPDFGKWLTYQEAIASDTARKEGIDNTPSPAEYERMVYTYRHVYAPLCEHFGTKLPVTSFFRNVRLNALVGGSATSEHLRGGAVDINCRRTKHPVTNNQLFEYVRTSGMAFDQLIFENPDSRNVPGWVHISVRPPHLPEGNRGQVLKAVRKPTGKGFFYLPWPWTGGAATTGAGLLLGALTLGLLYWTLK